MIDWREVEEKEYTSFASYAALFGFAASELATRKLKTLGDNRVILHRHWDDLNINIELNALEESGDPVRTFLKFAREARRERITYLSSVLARHLYAYNDAYSINWERLKTRSQSIGIDIQRADWLEAYLREIPVIAPYATN